jgi:hypothetical protein
MNAHPLIFLQTRTFQYEGNKCQDDGVKDRGGNDVEEQWATARGGPLEHWPHNR